VSQRAGQEDAVQTVWWEPDAVCFIDQTRLPHTRAVVRCSTVAEVAAAIRGMVVRGAPAIGVTAAYGMALAALQNGVDDPAELLEVLSEAKSTLDAARPTAVNLGWATGRMLRTAQEHPDDPAPKIAETLLAEAHALPQRGRAHVPRDRRARCGAAALRHAGLDAL
jgi:methylthioribose-1-phosphate isomerase